MKKNLINSKVDRINVLNNPFAMEAMKDQLGIRAFLFDKQYYITSKDVLDFYGIDIRTWGGEISGGA